MGLDLNYITGQTPLDDEEIEGLLIPTITTHWELDEYEQLNIEKAIQWTLSRSFSSNKIFTEGFIKRLHSQMYGEVWSWAGSFRKSNKNLRVEWKNIGLELKYLLDDAVFWYENGVYMPDELAVRFKHRIVSIHCFANGNGRHSRLIADIIIEKIFKKPVFSWGASNLSKPGEIRKEYLLAIKAADNGLFQPILEFARS